MHLPYRFIAIALVATGACSISASAEEPTAPATARSDLSASTTIRMRVPNVEFKAVAFSDVIDFIRDVQHLNLYVNWPALEAAGVDRSVPVTLKLRQIPLHTVLDLTLRQANGGGTDLAWYISDNIVYITTKELASRQLITQVFDVRDLLVTVPDFTDAPTFQLATGSTGGGGGGGTGPFGEGGGGGGSTAAQESMQIRGDRLAELVKMLVRPDIWTDNGGFSSIRYFNGSLIVTAPRDVLQSIGR